MLHVSHRLKLDPNNQHVAVLAMQTKIKYNLKDGLVLHLSCGGIMTIMKASNLRDYPFDECQDIMTCCGGHEAQP